MLSSHSHIVINLLECNNKPASIYNISYNNTTRNKDRCNNFVAINRAARQDTILTTHATPPTPQSQTPVFKDKAISFKQSSSSDYNLDIIQLMGLEMPPVRRKGFSGNNYSVRNGPHSTTSLPNLHQAVSVRSSINGSTAPSTSQHHRGTAELLIGDDSSDSGVSSRSPTPINSFLASAGAAGDQGLADEHFIKKTIKEVKQVNSNSTNSSGSSSSVRLSGSQHNSRYSHHLGFHQEPQAKQHHSRNHIHRNNYSVNGNCNNSISNGSAENNSNKKRFHHSNRHCLPIQSPGRGRIMSGMVVHVPPLPPPVPPSMNPISSLPLHIMNHCPFSSMMYSVTTPPDRFLSKCHLVQITKTPLQLTDGSHWDELSKAVWNKFLTNQQTAETYKKKLTLWKCLYLYIKTMCPRYSLYLVGSTLSGFGSNTSDVDMCLIVRRQEMDQRSEALFHLSNILFHLHHLDGIEKLELVQAKVPILKFRERDQGIDVDLNCNNAVGIRNTHLLSCYSKLDWRVRPLVVVVKLWAQWHDINDAKNMTISSYSLALMVIHFLQCGVHPPVLPCLHSLYESKFSSQRDISSIDIHEEVLYRSDNRQSLGELLLQFFSYFDSFDYSLYAVSVRLAARIPIDDCRKARSLKNEPHQWKYLCIEEPFDLTNTARSVYDLEAFERIRSIIHNTYCSLNATHTLDSIFRIERSLPHKNHHNHLSNLHQQMNLHRNSGSHHHITHQQYSIPTATNNAWTNHHRSHSMQSAHNSPSSLMSEQTGSHTLQSLALSQPQIHTQPYLL